jgi:hypothetical protein
MFESSNAFVYDESGAWFLTAKNARLSLGGQVGTPCVIANLLDQ